MRLGIFIEKGDSAQEATSYSTETISIEATPKDEILLEEMRRRYDLQQSEIDTTNTKSGLVLAYLGTVIVILIASAPDIFEKIVQAQKISALIVVASIALFFYIVGVFCCVIAIAPTKYLFPMGAEEQEIEFYLSENRNDTVLQLLSQYSEYIQKNLPRVKSKNRWFICSLIFSLCFTVAATGVVCLVQF